MQCLAYKSKIEHSQCPAKTQPNSNYCGRHRNTTIPAFNHPHPQTPLIQSIQSIQSIPEHIQSIQSIQSNETHINILKQLEIDHSREYMDFIQCRKNYIKEASKHIELVEYMENNKMDCYPYTRIIASLEYYNLIKKNTASRFILAVNNINILASFFESLLTATLHTDKLVKLQRWIKSRLKVFNNKIRGIGYLDRSLCVNDSDFVSLDDLVEIPDKDFVSFRDDQGFIYGFNLDSLVELILKSDEHYLDTFTRTTSINLCYRQYIRTLYNHYNKLKINNPYTRFLIPGPVKLNVFRLYAQQQFIKKLKTSSGNNTSNTNSVKPDNKTAIRNRCFAVMQKIDIMGYFTDIAWLMDENVKNIKAFYRKMAALWNYEMGLNNTNRYKIARVHNLFNNLEEVITSRADKYHILDKVLTVMSILVSNGEMESDQNSGAILILYAFAAINPRCIQANPWLA